MPAQSAALGIAAAAAFSSAAIALPCAEISLGKPPTLEMSCTVSDETSSPRAHDEKSEPSAGAPQDQSRPEGDQSALFLDLPNAADDENFARRDIKITNLQATMTSNKYVAGRLPTAAAEETPVEDLITLSPDYFSTKMLPHIRQRKPVGLGLVTVPKPPVKEPDTNPPDQWFPQRRPLGAAGRTRRTEARGAAAGGAVTDRARRICPSSGRKAAAGGGPLSQGAAERPG